MAQGMLNLGQAEVEYLGVPALGDENVGRLNVAMNNARCVGRVESVSDLDCQCQNCVGF
jgi:hypothetical protein